MPAFSKKSLSLFLRNNCERQFILSLYNDTERKQYGMPERQRSRAALGLVGQAGYDWQAEKVNELQDIFGHDRVHINSKGSDNQPSPIDLLATLPSVAAYDFIVEADFIANTQALRNALGISTLKDINNNQVSLSQTRPDIVQVLPSLDSGLGPQFEGIVNPYDLQVLPNGNTIPLNHNDNRLRLRVIDVKLTAEPGAHYFAEVVYYSLALAAWLEEHHFDGQFVVIAAPAVWPGSHEASSLAQQLAKWRKQAYQPTLAEMADTLAMDIEIAPFSVIALRLLRFFSEELTDLLDTPWQELAWHLDYHCKGCEFIGYPWQDQDGNVQNSPSQCWPTAARLGHLSRVFGMSRGATETLRKRGVINVTSLASTPAGSTVFEGHQGLRAKRSTLPHRAGALETGTTSVIPHSGGDALMPRWPNLHIYLFVDYDLSSAITASIGVRAFWAEPLDFGSELINKTQQWNNRQEHDEVFLVDKRDIVRERTEFLKFLHHLRDIFNYVLREDQESHQEERHHKTSTFQVYLWDESQRKHFVRLTGRHLPYVIADSSLHGLAWLFPPSELLQQVEEDTRQSAITLVSNVVSNTIAAPIAHHYTLLDLVKTYKPQSMQNPLSIHPLYEEPMSDLLPAERIHEWWTRAGRWQERQNLIEETTGKKVYALSLVVRQLEIDLKNVLSRHSAPPVVRPNRSPSGVSPQGHLWREFTRLNAALEHLEVQTIRAMPPHEREARLKSARLTKRLSGEEEKDALLILNQANGQQLSSDSSLFVYEIREGSQDVNFRSGDFLLALSPEADYGFLDNNHYSIRKGTGLERQWFHGKSIADSGITQVSIVAIDRKSRLIALRAGSNNCICQLEREAGLDFSRNVVLDSIHSDFLTSKIDLTVSGIGFPPSATADPRILEALGLPSTTTAGTGNSSPASEALWEAQSMHTQRTSRDTQTLRKQLENFITSNGSPTLNQSQWKAWEDALSRRLSLVWGPPGTGKSRTLRAIVQGAVLDAHTNGRSLRVLITANTYNALDNVLLEVAKELRWLLPSNTYKVYRIQSEWRTEEPPNASEYPELANLIMNSAAPGQEIIDLRAELESPTKISIIGCVPHQLHNLSIAGIPNKNKKKRIKHTIRNWFDFVLLDEASQMDVATSTLVFSKLASAGSLVLAGDDLQLPPIHQAESPMDLENVVGSVYNYFRHYHNIVPNSLDINYRSNQTLLEFTRLAGYSDKLTSFSPGLALNFLSPVPIQPPDDWPADLNWNANWIKFLAPQFPAVSFVYNDKSSSQINEFEADSITALIWIAQRWLTDQLQNERTPDGSTKPLSTMAYDPKRFWNQAVGVVAPHRAQVAKIVNRLHSTFPTHPSEVIRSAVDTVERFQGQQRDIIIASFGVGDPDIIGSEDEFLFNLNRFNVLTSRARAKLIVFVTRSLLNHLSDDINILRESRLLKLLGESYWDVSEHLTLGYINGGEVDYRPGELRRKRL